MKMQLDEFRSQDSLELDDEAFFIYTQIHGSDHKIAALEFNKHANEVTIWIKVPHVINDIPAFAKLAEVEINYEELHYFLTGAFPEWR